MKKITALIIAVLTVFCLCVNVNAEGGAVYENKVDFNGLDNGQSFIDYDFGGQWEPTRATQNDGFDGLGDGGSLRFGPFTQLVSTHRLTGKYVFSTDIKVPNNQYFGVFVRTTGESLNGTPYFEHDGTESNGAADNDCIGSTGIYVIPRANKVIVCIKTADGAAPKGIGTDKTVLDISTDVSAAFTPLVFEDDGREIGISVGGELVCTVEMSDVTELDVMSEYKIFRRAALKDADGNEIKTVENCRICADFSTVAYGMRINSANIDNISITEYEREPEVTSAPLAIRRVDIKRQPDKSEYLIGEELDLSDTFIEVTYENGVKRDVAVTADMVTGFDSSTLGAKVLTVSYGGTSAAYSVYVVEQYGQSAATTDTGLVIDTALPEESEVKGDKPSPVLPIVIAAAAVVLCAVLAVAVIKGKGFRKTAGKED